MGQRKFIGGKDECEGLENQEQKERVGNRKQILECKKKDKKTHQDGRKAGFKGRNKKLL